MVNGCEVVAPISITEYAKLPLRSMSLAHGWDIGDGFVEEAGEDYECKGTDVSRRV